MATKRYVKDLCWEDAIVFLKENTCIEVYSVDDLCEQAKDDIDNGYYSDAISLCEVLDEGWDYYVDDSWGNYSAIEDHNDVIRLLEENDYCFSPDYVILKELKNYVVFKIEDTIYHLLVNEDAKTWSVMENEKNELLAQYTWLNARPKNEDLVIEFVDGLANDNNYVDGLYYKEDQE